MEEKKARCSFCEFLGKMVLKAIAVISVFAAINIIVAKCFNKKISVQVAIDDVDDKTDTHEECDDEETAEGTEESEKTEDGEE